MGKQDSSWCRVRVKGVVKCFVLVLALGQCVGGKQMSETLQRALSAVRGPSPGAKKLLNIPEDGGYRNYTVTIKGRKDVSFHSFPKDELLKAKWIEAIGREITCKNAAVCSRHFKKEHFKITLKSARLTDDAVPYVVVTAMHPALTLRDVDMREKYTRHVDIRLKMHMAQSLVEKIKTKTEISEVTPKLLGIDEHLYTDLKKTSEKEKYVTTSWEAVWKKNVVLGFLDVDITYRQIRDILMENYVEKSKIPTEQSLMRDIDAKSLIYSKENLTPTLKGLGFVWAPVPGTNKSIIIEDPKRVLQRHRYLKNLQHFRDEGRPIVYLEEKNYLDGPIYSQAAKWYLIMATETTLLNTFTYTYINSSKYLMAFIDLMLPLLPKNSVVVLEENLNWETHTRTKIPDGLSSKSDIGKWLEANNVPYDMKMHKAELILLVERFAEERYTKLESFLKGIGHEVLRRQKGFPNLSLTAPLVQYISKHFQDKKDPNHFIIAKEISDLVNACTEDQWKEMNERLKLEERRVYEDDLILDDVVDTLIGMKFQTGDMTNELDNFKQDYEYFVYRQRGTFVGTNLKGA